MSSKHVTLSQLTLRQGQEVELEADGGEYVCKGIIHSFTNAYIKLSECRDAFSGKKEPGVQTFKEKEIQSIQILKKPVTEENDDEEESSSNKPAIQRLPEIQRLPPNNSNQVNLDIPGKSFRSKPLVNRSYRDGDNKHLDRLHSINMAEVLSQVQIKPVPDMAVLDLQPGCPRLLSEPEQDHEHMEGDKFANRFCHEFTAVREVLWKNRETPPKLYFCPEKLYLIEKCDDFSRSVIDQICDEQVIGVALEGQSLGRKGKLSVLAMATPLKVFLFDIVKLGPRIFDEGLRDILEDGNIMKIFHDVRQPADILKHQYEVSLANVGDTLATHAVFVTYKMYAGYMPKYACTYQNLCRCYLGIKGADLFFPHYRLTHMKEDSAIWLERPLRPELEIGAVRNVMYLLDLYQATRQCTLDPFRKATDVLLTYIAEADDFDANSRSFDPSVLPDRFTDCLPNFEPNPYKANKFGVTEDAERRVHNFVQQMDPNLIFSRDCIHQNKACQN